MDRKGFTLIELLIVVVIIGILAAVAIPKFSNTKGKAIVGAMKADLRNYASAQESYYANFGTYADITNNATYYRSSAGNTLTSTVADGTHWEVTVANVASAQSCVLGNNSGSTGDGAPVCS
ncbi:MAG TPA: prepilin-type N-terminal cleavage/methylation domain-containing protein [Gemmatimonadales bacterium]|nr:prepilin-type N-terminal cleavage/methylation domain-containing protein [Gemmatimonadales bacterium]